MAAVAQIRSLAQELPHRTSAAEQQQQQKPEQIKQPQVLDGENVILFFSLTAAPAAYGSSLTRVALELKLWELLSSEFNEFA